jgi:hypothetical protein
MSDQPLELGSVTRSIGDPMCWTFKLDSGDKGNPWTIGGQVCGWSITYSKIWVGETGQGILSPSILELGMFMLDHADEVSFL